MKNSLPDTIPGDTINEGIYELRKHQVVSFVLPSEISLLNLKKVVGKDTAIIVRPISTSRAEAAGLLNTPEKSSESRERSLSSESHPVRAENAAQPAFYGKVLERAIIYHRAPLALTAQCVLCNQRTESFNLHRMDPEPQHHKDCPLISGPAQGK